MYAFQIRDPDAESEVEYAHSLPSLLLLFDLEADTLRMIGLISRVSSNGE